MHADTRKRPEKEIEACIRGKIEELQLNSLIAAEKRDLADMFSRKKAKLEQQLEKMSSSAMGENRPQYVAAEREVDVQ